MNYKQTMDYLENLSSYGIVPGLTNMENLCEKLGNPQDKLNIIHIAGTNGKGSVLAYLSTVLQCAGYKCGRYISPVIFEYREKIQINQKPISQNKLVSYVEKVKAACDMLVEEGKPHPTQFEFETALCFLYFMEEKCDVVVLETGMGGRLDATNIIRKPLVTVLASISMDHMKFLGNSLKEIATEKAGICKAGCPIVTMSQEPEAMAVIQARAEELGSSLSIATSGNAGKIRYGMEVQKFNYKEYKDLAIPLAGKHQIDNAVLAVEVIQVLNGLNKELNQKNSGAREFTISEKHLRKGLLETKWPGRFSVIAKKPFFVVDGAHNEDAAKKLADSIRFYFTNRRIVYIMGVLKDKEYEKIIAETYAYADQIITITTPDNPRALPALELAQAVKDYHPNVTAAGSLEEAVEIAYLLAGKDDVIICFGSLSYQGKLIGIVEERGKAKQRKCGGNHGRQK